MYIRRMGLYITLFIGSLCNLDIRLTVTLSELNNVPYASILWNNQRSISTDFYLKVWQNSALKLCGHESFLEGVGKVMINDIFNQRLQVCLNYLPDFDLTFLCGMYLETIYLCYIFQFGIAEVIKYVLMFSGLPWCFLLCCSFHFSFC